MAEKQYKGDKLVCVGGVEDDGTFNKCTLFDERGTVKEAKGINSVKIYPGGNTEVLRDLGDLTIEAHGDKEFSCFVRKPFIGCERVEE